jgi:hypothetical protein
MTLAALRTEPAQSTRHAPFTGRRDAPLRSPEAITGEVKERLVASRRSEIRQVSPAPMVEPETTGLLRRPRLLARAAREGAKMYRRERDLRGSLPGMTGPRKGVDIVSRLLGIEAQIEADRLSGSYAYSSLRHVQVLSALVAESMALTAKRAEG